MKKLLFQGLMIVVLFFAVLFGLRQLDWMEIFHIRTNVDNIETKLGELLWDSFRNTEKEIETDFVVISIDSLVTAICEANDIDREYVKVHVLANSQVNAFALPNGHLVIFSQLILESKNEAELSGVISHELAHIELRHVMRKFTTEIGLSAIVALTAGSGGGEVLRAAKMLSSASYDRGLEQEADFKAVDYLLETGLNPEDFAHFLYRFSEKESNNQKALSWLSTHPQSEERSIKVLEYSEGKFLKDVQILQPSSWERMRTEINREMTLN